MNIDEFTQLFAEVFDDSNELTLTPDTYFKELDEYSSLTGLSIIAFADEHFNAEITGKEIRGTETVRDLYNLIISKQ